MPIRISDFLNAVFAAAKNHLRELDGPFFQTLVTAKRTQKLGLHYPGERTLLNAVPTQRLSVDWHELLEHTQSVYELFVIWNRVARHVKQTNVSNEDAVVEFQVALRSWITEGMAIVEHLKGWLDKAIEVAQITDKDKRGLKYRLRRELNSLSKGKNGDMGLASARVIQFHGLIDRQAFRAITEDNQWEVSLALGTTPTILQGNLIEGQFQYLQKWRDGHQKAHLGASDMFADIIDDAVKGLGWKQNNKAQQHHGI